MLRHVSRLKPSVFNSLSVEECVIHKELPRGRRNGGSRALTFVQDVLHDGLELVGTDLHVLAEGEAV